MKTLKQRLEQFAAVNLYFVTGREFSKGRSNETVAAAALRGGVKIIQYREKNLALKAQLKTAKNLRELTKEHQALLIINDHLDLAKACGADGVHLGQEDMDLVEAKQKAPELIIGLSCHNQKQALRAQTEGANYVNLGPIFPTQTKKTKTPPVGNELIEWGRLHLTLPFTVMGGINRLNIATVVKAGASKIAVVSALTTAADVEAEARHLIANIKMNQTTLKINS